MRDNCFKTKNTFVYTKYLLSNKYSQAIYSYQKAGSFYRFYFGAHTIILSKFSTKKIKRMFAQSELLLFKNIFSRRIDTTVSVFKCSL